MDLLQRIPRHIIPHHHIGLGLCPIRLPLQKIRNIRDALQLIDPHDPRQNQRLDRLRHPVADLKQPQEIRDHDLLDPDLILSPVFTDKFRLKSIFIPRQQLIRSPVRQLFHIGKRRKQPHAHTRKCKIIVILQHEKVRHRLPAHHIPALQFLIDLKPEIDRQKIDRRHHRYKRHPEKEAVADRSPVETDHGQRKKPQPQQCPPAQSRLAVGARPPFFIPFPSSLRYPFHVHVLSCPFIRVSSPAAQGFSGRRPHPLS